MNKEEVERIALEVAANVMGLEGDESFIEATPEEVISICTAFLARIDAERGKDAVGYDALFNAIADATNADDVAVTISVRMFEESIGGKLFLSPTPTIPEGMALVPIEPTEAMVLAGTNEPLVDAGKGEFDQPEDYVAVWKAMLSAAQGERK